MKKHLCTILILLIGCICFQSCSSPSELEGDWTCTEVQADGKQVDELNPTEQGYVGMTIKIEGNEFTRRQQTQDLVLFNKGVVKLSSDKKTLTMTDKKIAEAYGKWRDMHKELVIPIQFDVLELTDKKLKIRQLEKNLFGDLLIFTYQKK